MGFLNKDSLPHLVEKLSDGNNIKITGNSKGNRVGTVIDKIVEKADDVTKAIEQEVVNESYSFKVGTGDVDVSSSAEDGFGEVGIKGVTYHNIVKSYKAENFILHNASLVKDGYFEIKYGANVNATYVKVKVGTHLYKPSTKYTVIVDIKENTCDKKLGMSAIYSGVQNLSPRDFPNKTGMSMSVITTREGLNIDDKGNKPILDLYFGIWEEDGGDLSKHITFKYWILEGDHTSNLNLPSYFEGIVGVGDKSKNLFNGKLEKAIIDANGFVSQHPNPVASVDFIKVKPNTTYIISMPTQVNKYVHTYDKNFNVLNEINTRAIFTTPINCEYIKFNTHSNTIIEITEPIQIEEGTVATPYEPYYEGYKIEILSCGKNLLNLQNKSKTYGGLNFVVNNNVVKVSGTVTNDTGAYDDIIVPIGLCPISNGNQVISAIGKNDSNIIYQFLVSNESGKNIYSGGYSSKSFNYKIPSGYRLKKIRCLLRTLDAVVDDEFTFQLEESPVATEYQPYQEDKTQILLDEPLMRLPNGVCDEITRDGKLIKRTYKFKLNRESLNNFVHIWGYQDATTDYIRFYRYMKDTNLPRFSRFSNGNGLCNLISTNANGYRQEKETFGVGGSEENLYISFSISSDKILNFDFDNYGSVENRNLILDYLDKNNYEIYYELETPMITELSAPSLRIFKDGHLTFNTLVAPTSTHLVQLNKSAQIERSIREVQGLDGRVEKLESFYDDMILETSHKLNLLNYDFDYMRNTEDEI